MKNPKPCGDLGFMFSNPWKSSTFSCCWNLTTRYAEEEKRTKTKRPDFVSFVVKKHGRKEQAKED